MKPLVTQVRDCVANTTAMTGVSGILSVPGEQSVASRSFEVIALH